MHPPSVSERFPNISTAIRRVGTPYQAKDPRLSYRVWNITGFKLTGNGQRDNISALRMFFGAVDGLPNLTQHASLTFYLDIPVTTNELKFPRKQIQKTESKEEG